MQPIADTLLGIKLGDPVQFRNMSVFPLIAPSELPARYVLLAEALEKNLAHVSEVSESGRVPELLFINDGEDKVLLVDGEELIGARQNRILNVSILVGGKQKIVVPVSCVEQGRWHYKSRTFKSADHALFAKARAKKMRQVSASLRESGRYYANQAEVWSDISEKAAFLHAASDTNAMSDIFEQNSARIEDYVKAFKPGPNQAGALFAINGKIIGLELFDSTATFRRFMAKLVRSYAIDAIEEQKANSQPPGDELARKFIEDVKSAALQRFRAIGEGEDLRIESETITGGALYAGERVVHLCAFKVEK
jgi:flavodoxin